MSITPFEQGGLFNRLTMNEKLAEIDDEIIQVNKQVNKIGDIKITARTDLGDNWLLCNGDSLDKTEYPELSQLLLDRLSVNTNAVGELLATHTSDITNIYPRICKGEFNGNKVVACIYYSITSGSTRVYYFVVNADTGEEILSGSFSTPSSWTSSTADNFYCNTVCYICSGNLYVWRNAGSADKYFVKIPLNGDAASEFSANIPYGSPKDYLKGLAVYNNKLYFIAAKGSSGTLNSISNFGLYRANPDFTNQELLQTFSTPAAWSVSGQEALLYRGQQFDILETGEALISLCLNNNAFCWQTYYISNVETNTTLIEKVAYMFNSSNTSFQYSNYGMASDGTVIVFGGTGNSSAYFYHPSVGLKPLKVSTGDSRTHGVSYLPTLKQFVIFFSQSSNFTNAAPVIYKIENGVASSNNPVSVSINPGGSGSYNGGMSEYVDIGGAAICCLSSSGFRNFYLYKNFGIGLPVLPEITSDASFNYIKAKEDS